MVNASLIVILFSFSDEVVNTVVQTDPLLPVK